MTGKKRKKKNNKKKNFSNPFKNTRRREVQNEYSDERIWNTNINACRRFKDLPVQIFLKSISPEKSAGQIL